MFEQTFKNTDKASVSLRRLLPESCKRHTVPDCPGGTFQAAGHPKNLWIFCLWRFAGKRITLSFMKQGKSRPVELGQHAKKSARSLTFGTTIQQ